MTVPNHGPVRIMAVLAAVLVAVAGCASPPRTPAVADAWWAAWNDPDPARLGALFTDDATYRDIAVGKTSRGRDGVVAWKRRTDTGIDRVQVTPEDAFSDGDRVAVRSTYGGQIRGAPTPFRVHMVTVLQLRGGLIADNADYYDVADLLRQSGLPPDWRRP